jgi:hypothetical protein
MTSITGAIASLTGEEAIRVLADTADYEDRLPDPAEMRALETGHPHRRRVGRPGPAHRGETRSHAQGRWTFTVHKHPVRDSTLDQVISKLHAYLPGSR